MSAAPTPIVVPDGESPFALPVATCLARAGHPVHVLSLSGSARIRFSRHRASFGVVASPAARLERVLEIARRIDGCVVLPVSEAGIEWAIEHAAALRRAARLGGLPDGESFAIARDKLALARFSASRGLPCPDTRPLSVHDDPLSVARDLGFPMLWKPARGFAGSGIRRIHDLDQLVAFARIRARAPGVLQTEIPGQDLGLNVLCRDGAIVAACVQRPLAIGAREFRPATAVALIRDDEAMDVARRLVQALRWSGVMNVDLRRDARDGRIRVLETNPRYWATMPASCCAGVHFPRLACLVAEGETIAPPTMRPCRYVRTGTAVKAALAPWAERPSVADTNFWDLVSDPLPFVAGRISREAHRLRDVVPSGARAARDGLARFSWRRNVGYSQ